MTSEWIMALTSRAHSGCRLADLRHWEGKKGALASVLSLKEQTVKKVEERWAPAPPGPGGWRVGERKGKGRESVNLMTMA